jgi:EmrB/QacA subfamily drug resistance transporter
MATSDQRDGERAVGADVAEAHRLRWLTLGVVIAGTLVAVLNSTIVNVALPDIAEGLDSADSIEWVVSSYLLAGSVVLPVTGWLGERIGHKRLYLTGLAVFSAASLLCAASTTFSMLVVGRALQGLGSGILLPVGLVLLLKVFPREEHGRALGLWGMAAMGSPAIGPTLGGWLADIVAWNWLFLVNVPIGVATLVVGATRMPRVARGAVGRFDVAGFITGSIGLGLLVLGLSEGTRWGWGSLATIGCLGGGVILLVAFVLWELRVRAPMLDLSGVRLVTFSLTFAISFVVVGTSYVRMVFVPLELVGVGGYTTFAVGLSLAPAAIATAVGVSIGGRICDRIGPRSPIIVGVVVVFAAGLLTAAVGFRSPLWVLVSVLSIQGFGVGLHQAPVTVAAMSSLPSRLVGQGSTLRTLGGNVSGAMFVAGLGAVLSVVTPTDPSTAELRSAFEAVFWVSSVLVAPGIVMAWYLRRGPVPSLPDEPRERSELTDAIEESTVVGAIE